jgi:hypothetical protein
MLLHTVETTFIYTILSCLSFLLKWEERISLALLWSAISIECLLYKSSVMTKGAASLNYEAMLICQFFSSKRIVNFPIEPLTKFIAQYLYHDFSFEFDQLRCNEGIHDHLNLSMVFIPWKFGGRPLSLTGWDSLLQYNNHFMDGFFDYIYKVIFGGSCFIEMQFFPLSYSLRQI